jgi:hypothetical protein
MTTLWVYEHDNSTMGWREWVVADTATQRDVKTFIGPFAKFRAMLYVRRHG